VEVTKEFLLLAKHAGACASGLRGMMVGKPIDTINADHLDWFEPLLTIPRRRQILEAAMKESTVDCDLLAPVAAGLTGVDGYGSGYGYGSDYGYGYGDGSGDGSGDGYGYGYGYGSGDGYGSGSGDGYGSGSGCGDGDGE